MNHKSCERMIKEARRMCGRHNHYVYYKLDYGRGWGYKGFDNGIDCADFCLGYKGKYKIIR